MKIGTLAKFVGCHVETIRYYEKEKLLPPSDRAPNGYRVYSDEHLKLLRLIRYAKTLGFSQKQVRALVALATSQNDQCGEVHQLTLSQIEVVSEKLDALRRIKRALTTLSKACEENKHQNCPVLEIMVSKQ